MRKQETVEGKTIPKRERKSLRERGQSIVIIAAGMIVLLGFTGLAVDLGALWVRDSQLTAAIDAAALAGAPEVQSVAGNNATASADRKAISFLHGNDIPLETIQNFTSSVGQTELGAVEYSITATWRVDTYFMVLFGIDQVPLTRSATAAYFPLVDIYASSRVETGVLSTSNQAVFGPAACTSQGDPFSPLNSEWAPGLYSYRYRILIPASYDEEIVRVELFDPDSFNRSTNDVLVTHTQRWFTTEQNKGNNPSLQELMSCPPPDTSITPTPPNPQRRWNACVIPTRELTPNCTEEQREDPTIFCSEDINLINPYWFVRVDENRTPNPGCSQPGSYATQNNTATNYELYYFRELPDKSLIRTPLASYTGQTGNGAIDGEPPHGDPVFGTDLQWVSPGAFNAIGDVPTNCGSPTGGSNPLTRPGRCTGPSDTPVSQVLGSGSGFEINLNTHTPNIVVDPGTGNRFIYLDVRTLSGSSENGFEVWAGPPTASAGLDSDANTRNVRVADTPNVRNSKGVSVFAMGVLPMNSTDTATVDIPLIYVPASYSGRTVSVSLFDTDSGTKPPLYFYFDTIFFDPDEPSNSDYYVAYGEQPDPDRCFSINTTCNNQWVGSPGTSPAYTIKVPTQSEQCTDPNDPAQKAVCTPFYGGRLMARYKAGTGDTYVWIITLPSLPYLVK